MLLLDSPDPSTEVFGHALQSHSHPPLLWVLTARLHRPPTNCLAECLGKILNDRRPELHQLRQSLAGRAQFAGVQADLLR